MVFLTSSLEKSTFFPVFKVFITKVIVCLQPVIVSRIVIRLIAINKRKTKIMFFKIIFFDSLKSLTKFEYFVYLLCEHDEVDLSSKLKKILTRKYIGLSYMSLKVNLHIFSGNLTYSTVFKN